MIRSVGTAAALTAACFALLCDPFAGDAAAGPRGAARRVVRNKANHLARQHHHLRRDILRDQRHEKHVRANLHDVRKFLHGHRDMKNKTVRNTVRHRAQALNRREHHLERDIHRDKRHDKHVKSRLSDLRKFLHKNR
jgi:exonuclease VII large subunit